MSQVIESFLIKDSTDNNFEDLKSQVPEMEKKLA